MAFLAGFIVGLVVMYGALYLFPSLALKAKEAVDKLKV